MSQDPVDKAAVNEAPPSKLPEGVRGPFDESVVRDYSPSAESRDPLMKVELGEFEGPLDLLLHLIKRDGMDIFDIPVAEICRAYLHALDQMHELNLDVAAEFLLMAATLAHIKSKMLLPKDERPEDEDPEDEGDPRAELVCRLLEYQKYRRAAQDLLALGMLGRNVFARPPVEAEVQAEPPLAAMDAMNLVKTLARLFARADKKIVHEVFIKRMSVGARINELIDICRTREHITFDELLAYGDEPIVLSKRVVTFLSLLEMTRLKLIQIHQPSDKGTIYVTPIAANLDIDPQQIQSSFDADLGASSEDAHAN